MGYIQNNRVTSGTEYTCFYLPHCFVFKAVGTTKCTPAVIPGSVNTSTRVSQNDMLHTGPTAHFFTHQVLFSANMKMHQQIIIHHNDQRVREFFGNSNIMILSNSSSSLPLSLPTEQLQCFASYQMLKEVI